MRLLRIRGVYILNNSSLLRRCINSDDSIRSYCTIPEERSRKVLFFDERVQELLKKLTGKDFQKIFRTRKYGGKPQTPQYKFMSDEELAEAYKDAEMRGNEKLQMPPILPPRKEIDFVFISDDKLKGCTDSKFVFTDITYGKNDRNRVIVVREPDGKLRKANWEERNRMNEIYFPVPGRKLLTPKMFRADLLQDLLNRKEYLFTLDRACLQFEPDDPEFIRITESVFNHVNEESQFNILRSTRHYGPLIFYLVKNRKIENLLIENLETDRLEEATWAIDLNNILNPENKCNHNYIKGEELEYIKAFIDQCVVNKGKLELVYVKCKDLLKSSKVQAVN